MNATNIFLEPLDVLFLRGNKLFGDPGSFGESLVPPWPSVAAGALRSRMLADSRIDLAAFAGDKVTHPELGKPASPGTFTVAAFHLARRLADGRVEILVALPADLVVSENAEGEPNVRALAPQPVGTGKIASSSPFAHLPVLAETTRGKPASGYWLTEAGWRAYLAGRLPTPAQLVKAADLWAIDARVGVGLDAATGRASDGRLFSVQAVAMRAGFGFLAAVAGATPPQTGSVGLGGDGRAAAVRPVTADLPEPDYKAIAAAKRCRLVLTTPGIFANGWVPTGMTQADDGTLRFDLAGVQARVVCAAVPRFDTVSGWDLARWQPKPAERAAPAGSVYWLDELDATPDALRKLAAAGLWRNPCEDASRRAEGFNRLTIAAY
jgi:CRISPR-associated protein Cmr3